ncbi:MAG: ribonuclease domain-containing protein [Gallionella sp.]
MAQLFRVWLIVLLVVLCPPLVQAAPLINNAQDGLPFIMLAELPADARDTLRAIEQGGSFSYPRDGAVFGNLERILPKRSRGYYHEYTVNTSGVNHRGARRIVCGPMPECYYSPDHYQTFKRIRE